jgi:hypothetical protein
LRIRAVERDLDRAHDATAWRRAAPPEFPPGRTDAMLAGDRAAGLIATR